MSHIFISYASEDRKRVQPLAHALTKIGWEVWWDRRILAGKSYDEAIHDALKAAKSVVVVWTKTSVKSTWVRNESRSGLRRGILFPVTLADEVEIPLEFEHEESAQLGDWQPDQDHPEFDRFIEALAGTLGKPPKDRSHVVKPGPPIWVYLALGVGLIGALVYFSQSPPPTPPEPPEKRETDPQKQDEGQRKPVQNHRRSLCCVQPREHHPPRER